MTWKWGTGNNILQFHYISQYANRILDKTAKYTKKPCARWKSMHQKIRIYFAWNPWLKGKESTRYAALLIRPAETESIKLPKIFGIGFHAIFILNLNSFLSFIGFVEALWN